MERCIKKLIPFRVKVSKRDEKREERQEKFMPFRVKVSKRPKKR